LYSYRISCDPIGFIFNPRTFLTCSSEDLLQEHAVTNFAKCLTAYMAQWLWLPMMLTLICGNSDHLQVCILNKRALQSHQRLPGKTMLVAQRNEGLFWLNSIMLSVSDVFQQKLHSKVYILFFNSCVKFHAKIQHTAEMSTKAAVKIYRMSNLSCRLYFHSHGTVNMLS